MDLSLLIILEICFIWWLGVITNSPFAVCLIFFVYLKLFKLNNNPTLRTSWIVRRILPEVEICGPGRHLMCEPGKKCCDECTPFNKNDRAIFGVHPHGLRAVTMISAFVPGKRNSNRRLVGHSALLSIPILREICTLAGAIPAEMNTMVRALENDQQLAVVPGALRELTAQHGIKKRLGFIRVALIAGNTVLVPAFAQDETDLYDIYLPFGNFFLDTIRMRYPWLIMSIGKRWMWLFPKNPGHPLRLWVGEAIKVDGHTLEELQTLFYESMDNLEKLASEEIVE